MSSKNVPPGANPRATTSRSGVAKALVEVKPGWTSRVFGIETGTLVAGDPSWDGATWTRGNTFRFLYRSKRGKFFLLTTPQTWTIIPDRDARDLFQQLPEKVVSVERAFEPVTIEAVAASRDDEEDERIYKIVRNDRWEFSIWLDLKEVPSGWYSLGVSGAKRDCLEFINQNCVFGAPNPGLL
jgi:uncharacterized protein YbdZ (MbtH family)